MLYIAQVIAYTGLMFLVYLLFLRNSTLHRFNRFYLLASVILPVLIPFVKIPEIAYQSAPAVSVLQMRLPEYVVAGSQQAAVANTLYMVWIAYAAISLGLIALIVYRFFRLRHIIRVNKKVDNADYTLVYNTGHGPGSWMRYILLPQGGVDEAIINHELVHIQQRHSIDIVLLSLVQAVFWPNIFLFWIKKELLQVHEFQADAGVDQDAETYSQLLVASAFGTCTLPLSHSFIIHPIKRRIVMLTKNKRRTPVYLGLAASLVALFLVFNVISLQSCKSKTWNADKKEQTTTPTGEEVLQHADKMPEFEGDISAFLGNTIEYPDYARANNIEGRVNVQFVVGSDGVIRDIGPVGVKADTGLTRAALEAVAQMPKWLPGEQDGKKVAVLFTLPVSFKLK